MLAGQIRSATQRYLLSARKLACMLSAKTGMPSRTNPLPIVAKLSGFCHAVVESNCCLTGHRMPVGISLGTLLVAETAVMLCRYVILPKDFEKGYKANVKKSDADFDFYR